MTLLFQTGSSELESQSRNLIVVLRHHVHLHHQVSLKLWTSWYLKPFEPVACSKFTSDGRTKAVIRGRFSLQSCQPGLRNAIRRRGSRGHRTILTQLYVKKRLRRFVIHPGGKVFAAPDHLCKLWLLRPPQRAPTVEDHLRPFSLLCYISLLLRLLCLLRPNFKNGFYPMSYSQAVACLLMWDVFTVDTQLNQSLLLQNFALPQALLGIFT